MKQEYKELLFKDLCSRLPYGVKAFSKILNKPTFVKGISDNYVWVYIDENNYEWEFVEDVKIYLRPLSSIIKEEREELKQLSGDYLEDWTNAQTSIDKWKLDAKETYKRSVFYNSHYFDWNDLIPIGLALEAPEGMYNIKKQ